MRRKRNSYKFAGKKHSAKGKVSLALGLLSALAGIALVAASVREAGNASVYVGSIGLLSMFLACASLVIGISGFGEDTYKLFPILGSLCSALALAGWAAIYALGFYL